MKYLWVLAGTGIPFINADEIEKVKFPEKTVEANQKALVIVDEADIYENSNDENPFALKASIKNGKFTFLEKPTPVWLSELTEIVG